MICKKCGRENKDSAKYCGGCGAKLKKKNKAGTIFFITIFVIAALAFNDTILKKITSDFNEDSQAEYENESFLNNDSYNNTNSNNKSSEYDYQLNESFEIGGLYFKFTKAFSDEKYGFWETSADGTTLAGFEGTVRNTSSYAVNLNDFSYYLYFIDGNGKCQQTTEPRVECYAPSTTNDLFSTSNIIGAGQEGSIYIFSSPDEYCEALYVNISDPDTSNLAIVENTYYYNGSYENEDKTSFVRMAKGYSEDLACVQFYANEREYYGYMDKDANMIFYFSSKCENSFCDPPTDFENGYAHYKYGRTMYVFNKDGQVTSTYDDDCVAYGNGYTWVETDLSGFDGTGSKYTLYGPDGTVEAGLDDAEGENDFLESSHAVTIDYLGSGIFLYEYWNDEEEKVRKYYFTQSHKWVTVDVFNDVEDTEVLNGWLYNCVYYIEENRKKYLDLYDKNGENIEIAVPDELYDSVVWVCDVTDQYVLFESRVDAGDDSDKSSKTFWIYKRDSKEFKSYNGRYMDRIDDDGYANKLFQDSIVISMDGQDGNDYIGFIRISDMTELGNPILARSVEVYKDVTVVNPDTSSDIQQVLYDPNGNAIYTYMIEDYTGWLGGFNDNIMVAGCGYDYNDDDPSRVIHKFMDYSGNPLFDEINYSSGSETVLSADAVE